MSDYPSLKNCKLIGHLFPNSEESVYPSNRRTKSKGLRNTVNCPSHQEMLDYLGRTGVEAYKIFKDKEPTPNQLAEFIYEQTKEKEPMRKTCLNCGYGYGVTCCDDSDKKCCDASNWIPKKEKEPMEKSCENCEHGKGNLDCEYYKTNECYSPTGVGYENEPKSGAKWKPRQDDPFNLAEEAISNDKSEDDLLERSADEMDQDGTVIDSSVEILKNLEPEPVEMPEQDCHNCKLKPVDKIVCHRVIIKDDPCLPSNNFKHWEPKLPNQKPQTLEDLAKDQELPFKVQHYKTGVIYSVDYIGKEKAMISEDGKGWESDYYISPEAHWILYQEPPKLIGQVSWVDKQTSYTRFSLYSDYKSIYEFFEREYNFKEKRNELDFNHPVGEKRWLYEDGHTEPYEEEEG